MERLSPTIQIVVLVPQVSDLETRVSDTLRALEQLGPEASIVMGSNVAEFRDDFETETLDLIVLDCDDREENRRWLEHVVSLGPPVLVVLRDDDEETFDLDAGDAFDEEFDDEDELLGEDDEIEDFVEDDEDFMADDDDFDDTFSAGESKADFVAPAVAYGPEEQEWGGLMFGAVLLGSFAMVACGLVMFDLVRFMWTSGDAYNQGVGPLIDLVGIK